MKILLGNNKLLKVGGTENYVYALAIELKRRGHDVEYFTFEKGEISDRLEQVGVPFMSQPYYDLIITNHNVVADFLSNKGLLVQTCHGTLPAIEQPTPSADFYVAVSAEVRAHLKGKGYDAEVIHNGIDCDRFSPKNSLHAELCKVLSLCQSERANDVVRSCCAELGVEFIACNKHTDNVFNVENLINEADMVVGVGRSVYDAMACGRCVVSFDFRDYMEVPMGDGYLEEGIMDESLLYNCTGRGRNRALSKEILKEELQKYNPEDGAWARKYALDNLNIRKVCDKYLSFYTIERKADKMAVVIKRYQQGDDNNMLHVYNTLSRLRRKNKKHLCYLRVVSLLCVLLALVLFLTIVVS